MSVRKKNVSALLNRNSQVLELLAELLVVRLVVVGALGLGGGRS